MSGAFFNPKDRSLSICVTDLNDLFITEGDDGTWVIDVKNLDEGIEIFHDEDRLWRPA